MSSPVAWPRPDSAVVGSNREAFGRDGFIVLRSVFSPGEMRILADEADRLIGLTRLQHTNNRRCRWQNHVESEECLFETFDPVIDLSEACAATARDPRLIEAISALYGEPAHLFKDKLIFKPPGIKGYDLHQDYIAWPSFPRSFITAALAIDPCGADNGATEVFPGLHHHGSLTPEDGEYHRLGDEVVADVEGVVLELQPGDVAIFGGFTPHRSAPNRTDRTRRLLYLSYNADSDGGDCRDAHYAEYQTWLATKYAEYGKTETYFE